MGSTELSIGQVPSPPTSSETTGVNSDRLDDHVGKRRGQSTNIGGITGDQSIHSSHGCRVTSPERRCWPVSAPHRQAQAADASHRQADDDGGDGSAHQTDVARQAAPGRRASARALWRPYRGRSQRTPVARTPTRARSASHCRRLGLSAFWAALRPCIGPPNTRLLHAIDRHCGVNFAGAQIAGSAWLPLPTSACDRADLSVPGCVPAFGERASCHGPAAPTR